MIPVLLMCLYRLFILWKVEIRSPGGHLPMNEKSISPNKIKRDKENSIRRIRNIEDPETDTFEMVFFINTTDELS